MKGPPGLEGRNAQRGCCSQAAHQAFKTSWLATNGVRIQCAISIRDKYCEYGNGNLGFRPGSQKALSARYQNLSKKRMTFSPAPHANRCVPCRHSLPARARNHADLAHVGDAHHAARELLEGTGEDGRRHVEQFFVVGFLTAWPLAQAFRSFSSWRTNPQVERYCLGLGQERQFSNR